MRNPLFEQLIDYAGVFPPASLGLPEATDRYARALDSEDGWILGPMLIRAGQLSEMPPTDLPLGIVVDAPIVEDAPPLVQVESRVEPGEAQAAIAELVGLAPVVYVESADPESPMILDAIAAARTMGHDVRAKIRTGGATATAFPSSEGVGTFIERCVDLGLPFKATAGLHHPVRHASAVPGAVEHGFVNVLAAVRCALSGDPAEIVRCLDETDPAAFDMATATWRGVGRDVPAEQVRRTFRSLGSCSFDEPAGYLRTLGVI